MKNVKILCWLFFYFNITQAMANNGEISLNGIWNFSTGTQSNLSDIVTDDYSAWDQLPVPGNWDTTKKYSEFTGKGYYQRTFTIPSSWNNKNIRLKFDAVYQTSKVWLNGKLLGSHVGGYTPFEFNITKHIDIGQTNSLVVMADNTYKRGAWWAWGGISRNVTLLSDNSANIVYQHISAVPDFNKNTVAFTLKYKLENYTNKSIKTTLDSHISFNKHINKQLKTTVSVEPKSTKIKQIQFTQTLSNYQLWSIEKPNLYTLHTTLASDNKVVDEQQDNFGIRKFEVKGEQFFLNNEPIRLNGVNRVHDHPDFGNTEPDQLVLSDIKDIKSLGANFSRLMHAPLSKNLLDLCDRLGYLVIGEIPVWGDDDPQSFGNNPQTKIWLKEMIERDFNHPAIVGWSVGNELRDPLPEWGEKTLTPDQFDYVNSMLDYVEDLDATRLKTYVSITAFGSKTNKKNEPFDKLDFISINSYGNAVNKVKTTHKIFPGKPIFLSEIGTKQIGSKTSDTLDEVLLKDLYTLKDLPYLTGFSLWSYNDYRSNYKGTPESGFREWGVVDERRNKKQAYYQLKNVFKYWDAKGK